MAINQATKKTHELHPVDPKRPSMQVHGRSEHWQVYNAIYLDFRLGFWWPPSEFILVSYGKAIFLGFDLKLLQSNNFLSQQKRILLFCDKLDVSFLGSLSSAFLLLWMFVNRRFFLGLEQVASVDVPLSGAQKRERQLWGDGPAIETLRVLWSQIATNDMFAAEDFWGKSKKIWSQISCWDWICWR